MTDTWRWSHPRNLSWQPKYRPIDCQFADDEDVLVGNFAGRDILLKDMTWYFDNVKIFENADVRAGVTHKKTRGSLIGIRMRTSIPDLSIHFSRKKDRVIRPQGLEYPIGLENINFANKYELYVDEHNTMDVILDIFTDQLQEQLVHEDPILPFTILTEHPDFVWVCLDSSPWRKDGFDPRGLSALIARYEGTLVLLESYGTQDPVSDWPPDTERGIKGLFGSILGS